MEQYRGSNSIVATIKAYNKSYCHSTKNTIPAYKTVTAEERRKNDPYEVYDQFLKRASKINMYERRAAVEF